MKITSTQLDALFRQQNKTSDTVGTRTGSASGFEAALAEQLGLDKAPDDAGMPISTTGLAPQASPQASLISQMLLGTSESQPVNPDEELIQSAFTQASGTLDMWDSYVNALGSSGQSGSLRDAYALLQGIDGQVGALKANTTSLRGQNVGLDSLVNELDVMTTTEKFKFNRGDYSA